jgi:hypothetical protein
MMKEMRRFSWHAPWPQRRFPGMALEFTGVRVLVTVADRERMREIERCGGLLWFLMAADLVI